MKRGKNARHSITPFWIGKEIFSDEAIINTFTFPSFFHTSLFEANSIENEKGSNYQENTTMSSDIHPMVPVPSAIRTVLRETAEILLNNQKPNPTLRLSLPSTPWSSVLGCVLDEDVVMQAPGYPPYNASIMDGYAIDISNFSNEDASQVKPDTWTHRVVERAYAGDSGAKATEGQETSLPSACYITTGAVVPDCYNCVVPVEECEVSESATMIRFKPTAVLQHHKWIRPVGCDIPESTIVLPKGHIMDPVAIGLAKQSFVEHITIKRRIKVGVLSTGNELITSNADGGQNHKGKIPDVNRPVLLSMLSTSSFENTCEPIDLGTVRDDNLEAMVKTVEESLDRCDIIITTGGISMGETDIVERVLVNELGGTLHFGRMHMKPGKPTTFVTIPREVNGDRWVKLVFAQPGNPCSAVVCTRLLVGPCLDLYFQGIDQKIFGDKSIAKEAQIDEIVDSSLVHPEIEAMLTHDIKLDAKRPEYHRVILTRRMSDVGEVYEATSTGVQRSSRLMSLRDAQGLMLLPHVKGIKSVAKRGEIYPVLLQNNAFAKESVPMRDSIHLRKNTEKELKVGVIQLVTAGALGTDVLSSKLEKTCDEVHKALNMPGSAYRSVIMSKRTFSDSLEELKSFLSEEGIDLFVLSCVNVDGAFQYHLDATKVLRQQLSKVANSFSLQARVGAASQDPTTAVYETVVGYVPNKSGSMLVFVHENGVGGALSNTRSLITHGLRLARGSKN